jgi:hypothetical protein
MQEYFDTLGDHIILEQGYNVTACRDGGYALVGNLFYRDWGVLIKTDHQGNLEFLREFDDSADGIVNVRQRRVVTTDHGFIIAGSKQTQWGDNDAFVLGTDSIGNRLWEWRYDEQRQANVVGSLTITDTTIVVGGTTYELNDNIPLHERWRKSWIQGLSFSGERQWIWTTDKNDSIGGNVGMNMKNTGGLIYIAGKSYGFSGWTGTQARIVRLDADLQFRWVKEYGDNTSIVNGFSDLQPSGDGGWIAAGQESHTFEDGYQGLPAWIMKIDDNGDVIWNRHDTLIHRGHYLSSLVVLPSGSIIAVGYLDSGGGRGLVIKVDQDGCLEPDCRTVSTDQPEKKASAWRVFPNPAEQMLHVKTDMRPGIAEFRLLDAQGRNIFQNILSPGIQIQTVSLPNLPVGVYVYAIMREGKLVAKGKLVITGIE